MDFQQPQEKIFCCLCGCNCHNNVCVDLGEEGGDSLTEKQRHYTLKKLARLNISADEPWLPTTICFVCEKRLSDAYEFVQQAESARESLHLLYEENLKIERENEVRFDPYINKSENSELENLLFHEELGINLIEARFKIDTDNSGNKCTVNVPQPKEETTNEIGSIIFHSDDDFVKENECTVDVIHDEKEEIPDEIEPRIFYSDNDYEEKNKCTLDVTHDENEKTNEIESRFFDSDSDFEEKFKPLTYTWADYSWSCLFCVNQFPTFEEFREHSITQHNVCNAYECTYCEKGFHNLKQFLSHVRKHRNYLKFNRYHWQGSRDTHCNILKSEFTCPGCRTCFNNLEEKTQHAKQYYVSTSTPYTPLVRQLSDNLTCRSCKLTYKKKAVLNTHIISNHSTEHNTLCDICGMFTPPGSYFKLHIIKVHLKQPLTCKICKITFSTASHLRQHVAHHSDTYLYVCNDCGKGYKCRSSLKSHIQSHNKGALKYKCPECPKRFCRKPGLKNHLRQHTGERPFSCTECNRTFVNWSNLRKHMIRIHKVEVVSKKPIVLEQETEEIAKWKEEVFKKREKIVKTK